MVSSGVLPFLVSLPASLLQSSLRQLMVGMRNLTFCLSVFWFLQTSSPSSSAPKLNPTFGPPSRRIRQHPSFLLDYRPAPRTSPATFSLSRDSERRLTLLLRRFTTPFAFSRVLLVDPPHLSSLDVSFPRPRPSPKPLSTTPLAVGQSTNIPAPRSLVFDASSVLGSRERGSIVERRKGVR